MQAIKSKKNKNQEDKGQSTTRESSNVYAGEAHDLLESDDKLEELYEESSDEIADEMSNFEENNVAVVDIENPTVEESLTENSIPDDKDAEHVVAEDVDENATQEVIVQEEVVAQEVVIMSNDSVIVEQTTTTTYTTNQSVDVEIPKNLDANVNIWQWHSRDDIVRDKFEKHIQKIRYDATILKQRNDILWYEKKLVEWLTMLPNDTQFQKDLADLYFHQGKYKKAQSLLKKIVIENPEDHNALWQMGEIAIEDGQSDEAFAYLQQAYNQAKDNPKYCYSLAQRYYDQGDLEAALPLMERIVKLRPNSIDYLVSLSHMQHKLWDREGAKQSILKALELDPLDVKLKQYLKALQ